MRGSAYLPTGNSTGCLEFREILKEHTVSGLGSGMRTCAVCPINGKRGKCRTIYRMVWKGQVVTRLSARDISLSEAPSSSGELLLPST
jgi:hypothetical protein